MKKGRYHVVDLNAKKVISTPDKSGGDDDAHITALKSWRNQTDLISAILGLSEDPNTRTAVAESQWAAFMKNAGAWSGQDKVKAFSFYFMIVHMIMWLPGPGKYGFNVAKEFAKLGVDEPSFDTDKQIAQKVANGFLRYAKNLWIGPNVKKPRPNTYADVRNRTNTHLWKTMSDDGKPDGFDPGHLVYDSDL